MQRNYFFPLEECGQLSFKKHLEGNFQKNPGEMRSIEEFLISVIIIIIFIAAALCIYWILTFLAQYNVLDGLFSLNPQTDPLRQLLFLITTSDSSNCILTDEETEARSF